MYVVLHFLLKQSENDANNFMWLVVILKHLYLLRLLLVDLLHIKHQKHSLYVSRSTCLLAQPLQGDMHWCV